MRRLTRKILLGLVLALFAGAPQRAAADPVITVYPSVAPNKFGSPSWPGYVQNAVNLSLTGGVQNGGAPQGNSASPTFYSSTSSIKTSDMIVTNFPSWHAIANPGVFFGPSFANETGNRATFGLAVNGNGSTFRLSDINLSITPSNPALAPFLSFSGNLGSLDYTNPGIVNTVVGREASSGQLVLDPAVTDLLTQAWYVGAGVALEVDNTDPGNTLQDKINNTLTDPLLQSPFTLTGIYTIGTTSGSGIVTVSPSGPLAGPIPEPSTLALCATGVGLAGLVARWRQRRRSDARP
jgi:hypothetical protein